MTDSVTLFVFLSTYAFAVLGMCFTDGCRQTLLYLSPDLLCGYRQDLPEI